MYQINAARAIESKNPVLGYNASKKLAEEAAWRFMKQAKPTFDMVVINPDIIIGPMIQPVPRPSSVNETNRFAVYDFLNGTYKTIDGLTFPFYHFVSFSMLFRL
jgi:nucleoside-diphosphate-sugar epimerase